MPSSDHTRGDGRDAASDPARAWPPGVFDAPVLRGLDERARREIAEAGRLRALSPDEIAYRAGDAGDAFFVVASGRVALRATRRGDDRETEVRTAAVGDVLGEEAVVGMSRRTTAVALAESVLAEVPVHLFRRAAGRSGKAEIAEKLERALRRSATHDLLGTLAFTRDLDPDDIEILLDAVSHRRFERGQAVYRAGDPAAELWLIADGMVQIQTEDGDRIHVRAYLTRGDFFGDVELGEGRSRAASAVASGAATLLSVPAKTFASLARKHPDLIPRLRRITGEQSAAQEAIVAGHARNHTAHVFRDLYRLQVARSLLVIDLETCARCGHCAWSCADVHGVSRLARRGDKVLARVDDDDAAHAARHGAPRSLLLPNSCQHCESPACMIDCPTGAIGKDAGGEVFIRDALCTGCGACAKACPWENIAMAPRPPDAPRPGGAGFPDLAVKCDLCRDHDGPACVKACPTGSIFRVNPAEEIADVRDLLGGARREQERAGAPRSDAALLAGSAIAAAGLGAAGLAAHARGDARPGEGAAWSAGVAAAAGMALLLLYAVPKRAGRWAWMRPRRRDGAAAQHRGDAATANDRRDGAPEDRGDAATEERGDGGPVRSRLRPHLSGHLAIGLVTAGLALAHAPWPRSGRPTLGAALHLAFWATAAAGALTAVAYRLAPRRLARIERTAALPEDFAAARRELLDRFYRGVSGRSDLVKKIVEKILVPYVQSPVGPLALLASGRGLRDEERALRARIDVVLEGRGAERLAGLSELIRLSVELRALPAQRALLAALRAGLPAHIITFGVAAALLLLHAITATSVPR
ncbi:cyclic nucleotide-binding domain-containing protein [Sorangium sp. So ce388]|uniref:cyclic nucleotide-binding domain-containing protein n=1 Tax=Sorangium sp. So ce388 TaxID=3133309 RepID=UPI003F5B1E45